MYMSPISRPKKVALSARWKCALRPAVVVERPVEQARAVGADQVLVDQAQVVLRLRASSRSSRIAWIIARRL